MADRGGSPTADRPLRALGRELFDERELVEAAKTSPEAFGQLYDRYVVRLYRYVYARTGSHQDAEDVTAETFRRAMEHLPGYNYRRSSSFGAWLFRIAANLLISRHRKERPCQSLDPALSLADADPNPEQVALDREMSDTLWAAVATLPIDQRRAVVLRFCHGLRGKEIARAMGRSEGAVKQLLYRAMIALQDKVKRDNVDG